MPDFRSALLRLVPATKRQRIAAGAGVVVIGLGVGLGVGLSGGTTAPTSSTKTADTAPAPTATLSRSICPLTDTPAPGGAVPRRPALMVKVGNEPEGARPQSGLNEADIVFDTPAEGFVMRYIAVYQCRNAPSIGPTRSVRWVDYKMIARMFLQPILAFAGGIDPNVGAVEHTPWLFSANLLGNAASAGHRISSRSAPDNLYTSTSALYSMFKQRENPPPPVFKYSSALPAGMSPAASVGLNFSYGTDVVWKWQGADHAWLHTYSGSTDVDASTNQPVTATNVVVLVTHYVLGPYAESTGGTGDIESIVKGEGTGYVMRDGAVEKVTWHRGNFLDGLTFTNAKGQAVDLAPGRTWVEIMPDVQAHATGGITITR